MMNQHPTVVISGGSAGLGKAIGLEAAKQGATVVFWRGGGRNYVKHRQRPARFPADQLMLSLLMLLTQLQLKRPLIKFTKRLGQLIFW